MINSDKSLLRRIRPYCWTLTWMYLALIYLTLPVVRGVATYFRELGVLNTGVSILFIIAAAAMAIATVSVFRVRSPLAYLFLTTLAVALGYFILSLEVIEERVHFIEYGVLTIGFFVSFSATKSGSRLYLATFLASSFAGAVDEVIQYFLPSRVFDLRDIGFNVTAAAVATLFCLILGHYGKLAESRSSPG